MKQPLNIRDLLGLLYQHKEVVEVLFGNKDSVNKYELLAREDMSDERLEKLVAYEIIHENDKIVSLDDRIVTFVEEFLEIGEVTTSFINDNVQSLTENLKYYRIDNNYRFLRNIKRSLKKIDSTTSREVIKLHKNIDDTYKNQSNYYIKLQELDKYKQKRDDIINLIKETEQIIFESQGFFNTIIDAELNSIVLNLRHTLVRNRDYLNEIQSQIIDYINKIQYQADVYRRVQRLKELKDYEELKYKTNFVEVAEGQEALIFGKKPGFRSRVSLDYLYSDEGYYLATKVATRLRLLRGIDRKPAGQFSEDLESGNEQSVKLNVDALVAKFMESDRDLFSFIQEFPFPKEVGELSFEKKISLYVGISVDHEKKLDFSGGFGNLVFVNEKNEKQRVGYALIYPDK
ncbi:hypothetical protein RCC89_18410 [Cytophagaceae bacterium ABcell3]|nr:hypothetical protein RCC89_18410 [Cytophagaceae bacterium ABcell3]